ncbi:MAG: hypothetical protein HONBIEJF_01932 [Fimbriimonadaceae bacterium]|nr:hypothetical protein [Fimbriimonadaceae bacterium]
MIAAAVVALLASPIDLDRSLRFLQSIKPSFTLADVKAKAGKGLRFGKPQWVPAVDGALPGYVVTISGPIQGSVAFLNRNQRQRLLDGKPGGAWSESLPIFGVLLTVESSKTVNRAKSRSLIDRIAKTLGKPVVRPDFNDEWANDFGGWTTSFRVSGRDVAFYQCNFGQVESRLELLLQRPLF